MEFNPLDIFTSVSHYGSPMVIGTMLASPLYGIMLGQSIWYFRCSQNDSTTIRVLVAFVILFDGIQTVGLAQGTFIGYLGPFPNFHPPVGMLVDIFFASFSVLLVHCAFVYRVWLMSNKRRYMTIGLSVLVFIRFTASMGLNITLASENTIVKLHNSLSNAFGGVEMTTAALLDILIAIAMALYLSRERSDFLWTKMLISKLITYFVGAGALTSIFAVLIMVSWTAMPKNLVFLIFHSVLSKLYGNSLLVILNSRRQIKGFNSATYP